MPDASSVPTPRSIAWQVLLRVERDRAWADRVLHPLLHEARFERRQRAFATELTYGSLRMRGRLDAAIAQMLDRPLEELDASVRNLLRVGAYQVLFMKNVPIPVGVSETVRVAKQHKPIAWSTGLLNAVLRRLAREADTLRFPDRDADPVGYLVQVRSLPTWLAERWIGELGIAEADELARALMHAPPRTVRLSPGAAAAALQKRLGGRVCSFVPQGLTELDRDPVSDTAFRRGEISVQDEASQLVPLLLGDVTDQTVVDCCAAPGGKAVQLAQAVGPKGEVIALERYGPRLGLIRSSLARLGLSNVRVLERDVSKGFDLQGQLRFRYVLVDAPCSGLGALRRNPDARWRLQPEDVTRAAETASRILDSAARYVEQDGVLVYSVCTFTPEETTGVLQAFLEAHPNFTVDDPRPCLPEAAHALIGDDQAVHTWPHRHGCDGFYAVRLVKRSNQRRRLVRAR